MRLLTLLPAHIATQSTVNIDRIVSDLMFWEMDLTHSLVLRNKISDWIKKWSQHDTQRTAPTNLLDALRECDLDIYPCIHKL